MHEQYLSHWTINSIKHTSQKLSNQHGMIGGRNKASSSPSLDPTERSKRQVTSL